MNEKLQQQKNLLEEYASVKKPLVGVASKVSGIKELMSYAPKNSSLAQNKLMPF